MGYVIGAKLEITEDIYEYHEGEIVTITDFKPTKNSRFDYTVKRANGHEGYVSYSFIKPAPVAVAVQDNVNQPAHYTKGGIETLDFLKAKMSKEQYAGFLRGNILKYVTRYEDKNGVEDLMKAGFYLTELIAILKEE